jgi:DNA-binding IclR family transcriptional regulator
MEEICRMLGPRAEVIADYEALERHVRSAVREEQILEMVQRRPCTVEDISRGVSIHVNEAVKCVQGLMNEGRLRALRRGGEVFYVAGSVRR